MTPEQLEQGKTIQNNVTTITTRLKEINSTIKILINSPQAYHLSDVFYREGNRNRLTISKENILTALKLQKGDYESELIKLNDEFKQL